jgi:hypothetical protein
VQHDEEPQAKRQQTKMDKNYWDQKNHGHCGKLRTAAPTIMTIVKNRISTQTPSSEIQSGRIMHVTFLTLRE